MMTECSFMGNMNIKRTLSDLYIPVCDIFKQILEKDAEVSSWQQLKMSLQSNSTHHRQKQEQLLISVCSRTQ